MDSAIRKTDLLMLTSEFANLLTIAKVTLSKLEDGIQQYGDKYSKKLSETKLKIESFEDNNIHEINSSMNRELCMMDLRKCLKELEFGGRAASLKTFFHLNNYLYIFQSPIKIVDHQYKLPVCNITFPKHKETESSYIVHKSRKKNGFIKHSKCKRRQLNVCE